MLLATGIKLPGFKFPLGHLGKLLSLSLFLGKMKLIIYKLVYMKAFRTMLGAHHKHQVNAR